jgi:hypothetical protein
MSALSKFIDVIMALAVIFMFTYGAAWLVANWPAVAAELRAIGAMTVAK